MPKRILIPFFIFILAFVNAANVFAQSSYLFSVDKEVVHVFWNADGTLDLDYTWTFTNNPAGHVIDFVDVGMPNGNYSTGRASADVNGQHSASISPDYQGNGSYGFSVDLGANAIQPGQTGTVHVYIGGITGMLYPDDDDETYASSVFSPTWFGSQYVTGSTDMTVIFYLPPNMAETEPRWHSAPGGFPSEPQAAYDAQNRITYTWYSPNASASEQYKFGASFPASYVPDSAIVRTSTLDVIVGLIVTVFSFIASSLPCLIFAAIFFGAPILSVIQANRRKMQYLPPKVSIEGHGIKRGLTAVESAILMEQPLDKVMTMILFGVIKKNAASVKTRDPLEIEVAEPLPEGLHEYEKNFLQVFKVSDKKTRQTDLQVMMVALIKTVSEKVRGFSRKETVDFYKSIMEKAWQQIEAAGTPEVKSQKFDEALEWTMLDKDYDDRTRRTFQQPIFLPRWWGNYDPTYRRPIVPVSSSAPVSVPSSSGPRQGLPGADFAASMVTGVQTFSQKVIGNVNTFTEKVTGKTNPPPPPSRSSGGGRSGGGCACACACAGCACACAGGGR